MAATPTDKAKYRRLRAHGVSHKEAVAQAATTPNPDFGPNGVGAIASVMAFSGNGGYLDDWSDADDAPAQYVVLPAGVQVVAAGVYHAVAHVQNDAAANINPYIAVLRGGTTSDDEVGPYWNLGIAMTEAVTPRSEVSAMVTAQAGDIITVAASQELVGARMQITKVA